MTIIDQLIYKDARSGEEHDLVRYPPGVKGRMDER